MGNMQTRANAELIGSGQVALRQAVTLQLRSNHWPPVPYEWIDPCIDICRNVASREWDLDHEIDNPVRTGEKVDARTVIEALHLWPFIEVLRAQE